MTFLGKAYVKRLSQSLEKDKERIIQVDEEEKDVWITKGDIVLLYLIVTEALKEALKELKSLYPERVKINKKEEKN
jgi:hypothetical protein